MAPPQHQCEIVGSSGGTVSLWGKLSPTKNDALAIGTQQPHMSGDGVFMW
jgi:hypothetical protein